MNDNQFDNLTRELGNGISRRDALKLLGAGIASVLLDAYTNRSGDVLAAKRQSYTCCSGPNGTCGEPPQAIITSVPENVQNLSCEGMAQYAKFIGVRDDRAIDPYHPGYFGITYIDNFFYTITDTIKTTPTRGGRCLKAVHVPVSFAKPTSAFALAWSPDDQNFCTNGGNGSPSPECVEEIKRWNNTVVIHESYHVQDNQSIVAQANAKWSQDLALLNIKVEECQPNAYQKILNKITELLNKELIAMYEAAKKCGDDFDRFNTGSYPNCSTCLNCGPSDIVPRRCETCDSTRGICVPTCDACQYCDDVTGTCIHDPSACPGCTNCQDGTTCCNNSCVNTETDKQNCGTCGTICEPYDNFGALCCNGECCSSDRPFCTSINGGPAYCGACEGLTTPDLCRNEFGPYCTDLLRAESDCGSCGNRCAPDEACCGGECWPSGQCCEFNGVFHRCGAGQLCCTCGCIEPNILLCLACP